MDTKDEFTTLAGKTWKVRAVSLTIRQLVEQRVRREFEAAGEPLDPPTYEVKLASGQVQNEAHDETTLDTIEDKVLWNIHQKALLRLRMKQNVEVMKVKFVRGIVYDWPPADANWEANQQMLGIEIPAGDFEKRYHYLTTEVLASPEDELRAMQAIDTLSYAGMYREEDIAAAVDGFRYNLLRAGILSGLADEKEQVELQRPAPGGQDSEGVGADVESVPSAGI